MTKPRRVTSLVLGLALTVSMIALAMDKATLGQSQSGGPSGYTFCASEHSRCEFSGTKDVAYGANGTFTYKKGIKDGIDCTNEQFGDPIYGVFKACYVKDSTMDESTQARCKDNQARLAVLEKQAAELDWDLKFGDSHTEELFRDGLAEYNKALASPERKEALFREKGWKNSVDARRRFFNENNLLWKDEYARDDLLMLRALRDDDARWVNRIAYARTHKAEIAQKKADVDRQIAFQRNRLIELGCG